MTEHRIGFVGAGNMAAALLEGLLRTKVVSPAQVQVNDIDRRGGTLAGASRP